MQIRFDNFRSGGARIFAGRPRGVEARKHADLDTLDASDGVVEIVIPDDTISVNSSFFLGMFENSIRKLGADGFRAHYQFVGRDIDETVDFCIAEVLRDGSPLPNV